MFHVSRTLKNGATAQDRAILYDVTAANGVPTTSGQQMVPRGVWQAIDMICYAHADQYDVGVWWYYSSADKWVFDADIGYNHVKAADGVLKFPLISFDKSECADGIYIEVLNFVGAGAAARVWLQGQQ
mgnify:FL=1